MNSAPLPEQGEPSDKAWDESADCVISISGSQLRDADVLFGRGSSILFHPGNVRYRRLIEENRTEYMATSRGMKTDFAQKLVKSMCTEGGRFLKRKSPNDKWTEVKGTAVVEKVKQALREKRKAEPSHNGLFRKRKVCDQNSNNSELDSALALFFNSPMTEEQSQKDAYNVTADPSLQFQYRIPTIDSEAMSAGCQIGGMPLITAPFSAESYAMQSLQFATTKRAESANAGRGGPRAPLNFHHSTKRALEEVEGEQRVLLGQSHCEGIRNLPPDQRESPTANDSRDSSSPKQENPMMYTFNSRLPLKTGLEGPSLQSLLSAMTPVSLKAFHDDGAQVNRTETACPATSTPPYRSTQTKSPSAAGRKSNEGAGALLNSGGSSASASVKSVLPAMDPVTLLPFDSRLYRHGTQVRSTAATALSATDAHSSPSNSLQHRSIQPNTLWSAAKRRKITNRAGDAVLQRQQEVYEKALRETASDGQEW